MPQADLYQCVAATGIVEGFHLAVDGSRFAVGKGKAYLHGQPMTGGFLVDFAGKEPGWYTVTAAGETCAAVRGTVPDVGLLLALVLVGGEGGIRMARDLRQRLLIVLWQPGETEALLAMPARCRVLRLQAAVLEQHEGGALWARKIAKSNIHVGDLLDADELTLLRCAFAAEHTGALALALSIEWCEP